MGFKMGPSTDIRHARRLGKMLSNSRKSGQVGVEIESARGGHYGSYKKRMAVISTGKGFYDPMESLRRAIHAHLDDEEKIQPVKHVEQCDATPMSSIRAGNSKVGHNSAMKRVPRGFFRMWGKKGYDGWFFVYSDRVLWVRWSRETGWKHSVVPPEGVEPRPRRTT